jgi:photosystem II stability/assembly factor-like uncharacterized protein
MRASAVNLRMHRIMKILSHTVAFVLVLFAVHVRAQVPQVISYQGLLTSSGNKYNGTGQFKFAMVNSAGSVTFWSNDGTSSAGGPPATAVALAVTNGLFNVLLGDTAIPHMSLPIPANIFTNADLRLRIWFSESATGFQQLAPDQRLGSVGSALQAANAAVALSVAPAVLANVGTVTRLNTGPGLTGGPITNTGTIFIPNAAISNAMLQNSSLTVTAGTGLAGGGSVPLGGNTALSLNLAHDATLTGNGAASPLGVNLANPNTWTATQTFLRTISGDISGTADGFRGSLAGEVTGPQGATVISNLLKWQVVSGASQQARANTGYILTSASQTTVTLPAAANIGDRIRLSAPGAGGWKIAQNAGQSILAGNFGSLAVGLNWTPKAPSLNWSAVTESSDGTKLAAVVNGEKIYVSTDSGTTWVGRDSNRVWSDLAGSADGTKLVATVNGGKIYTSTDLGASWTDRDTNRAWYAVASSTDGTKLAAVVNNGQIFTSSDSGITWTQRATAGAWHAVASSADGTKLIAAVYGGQIATSTDAGATWSSMHGPSGFWESVASSSDGMKLALAGRGAAIQTSTDGGTNWVARESARTWLSICTSADATRLAAVVSGGQIYLSTDSGVTWAARESNRSWTCIVCSTDGSRLAASVGTGQIFISIPPPMTPATTTTVGTTGYLLGGQGTAIELLYFGNNQFIPLSHEGTVWAF